MLMYGGVESKSRRLGGVQATARESEKVEKSSKAVSADCSILSLQSLTIAEDQLKSVDPSSSVLRRLEVVLSNARHSAGGGADSGTTSRSGDSIVYWVFLSSSSSPLYNLSINFFSLFKTLSTPSQPRIELLASSAPLPEPKCLKSTYATNVLVLQKQVC
jgi:hypothetical protein